MDVVSITYTCRLSALALQTAVFAGCVGALAAAVGVVAGAAGHLAAAVFVSRLSRLCKRD